MGNTAKSVDKSKKGAQKKGSKEIQLLPPLPEMYVPLSDDIMQHPDEPSLKIYTILMNKNQLDSYKKSLAFRQEHKEELIQVLYGEFLKDQQQYYKIRVYIENIQFTLQQFRNLHFFDLMAIFHKVFIGFKFLFENFGCFDVDPRMIGFNQKAQVRVWCNIKYSKPLPKQSYQILNEKQMLKGLIEIFMNKVDISTIPVSSQSRKFKLEAETFEQAIKTIEEQVQSVDLIPKHINSIRNLMSSGRKIVPNQVISMNSEIYMQGIDKTIKFAYSNPTKDKTLEPKVFFTFGRSSSVGNLRTPSSFSQPKVTFTHNTPTQNMMIRTKSKSRITFNSTANSSINQKSRVIATPFALSQMKQKLQSGVCKSGSNKTIKKGELKSTAKINFTYK